MIHRALLVPAILFSVVTGAACMVMLRQPQAVDFLSFWAAGKLALQGTPALAYDFAAHRAVEETAVSFSGLLPFPYPPGMLFLLAPFGWLSVGSAFVLWTVLTAAFYVAAGRHPFRVSLAHPAVVANGLIGQAAFLTTGLFLLGFNLLRSRPFVAGLALGLMTLKPQIAVLVPLALLFGRQWIALAGMICSAIALLALSVAVFGLDSLTGFLLTLPRFTDYMASGQWEWSEMASLYALASDLGFHPVLTGVFHASGAAFGLWSVAKSWASNDEARVPILAAASLLVTPYLFNYDALLLVVPFAWLLTRSPVAAAVVWCLALLALFGGPMAIATLASLVAVQTLGNFATGTVKSAV